MRAEKLSLKVAILRNNAFAHRSASLSYADIFRKASVTADELRELTEVGLRITNLLLSARGLPEQHFHPLPRQDVEKLLAALARIPAV